MFPAFNLRAQGGDVVVIVHPSTPVAEMSKTELVKIFKGETTRWPNGQKIIVIEQPLASPNRVYFYSFYMHVAPDTKFYISGTPLVFEPMVQQNDEAVLRVVSFLPYAISYVDRKNVSPKCKVLKVK